MSPEARYEADTIETSAGDVKIFFLGHGSLIFSFGGKIIHVDPYGKVADYSRLPKADLVLITHTHHDHLDPDALGRIRTPDTTVILPASSRDQVVGGIGMAPGDTRTFDGVGIEAVPAYNVVHKRDTGVPYHPKELGVGYVLSFGDTRIYVAGDTENIPEMAQLEDITVAFLPMNLPFTMTPEMVADAARTIQPKIVYPYHYGQTDTSKLVDLLKDTGIEVRIRDLA